MPSFNHGAVQTNLIVQFGQARKFRILSELSLELDGHKMTPDLSVYPAGPIDFRHDIIRRTDPPLLVVETSSRPDYAHTREFYARGGYCEVARVRDFYAPADDRIILTTRLTQLEGGVATR